MYIIHVTAHHANKNCLCAGTMRGICTGGTMRGIRTGPHSWPAISLSDPLWFRAESHNFGGNMMFIPYLVRVMQVSSVNMLYVSCILCAYCISVQYTHICMHVHIGMYIYIYVLYTWAQIYIYTVYLRICIYIVIIYIYIHGRSTCLYAFF